jgi:tetratricopeptide (TPR) repeat protein
VAQIGAALGRQFSHELIGAVASMPQPQLEDALAQLVGAELIYRRGTPPDAEYTFKHALVQDAAYSTLLRSRRLQLHARITAVLEDRFPEIVTAQPALLAHHCQEAGLTKKAVEYWLAAGRQAWSRSAVAEAAALLRRGLALVPELPDTDWRRERELDLLIALAQALNMSRVWGAPEMREVNARARELASMLNRPRALFSTLWDQVNDHIIRGDCRQAQSLAEELRELGDTAGDVPLQVIGRITCGYDCCWLGEFEEFRTYVDKAFALYDPADRAAYAELLPQDVQVMLATFSAWAFAFLGYFDKALSCSAAALEEARRLAHAPTLAWGVGLAAWFTRWWVREEPGSLLPYADELLALATENGLGAFRAWALVMRGWSLATAGGADEGIPLIAAGLAAWDELGAIWMRPWALTLLGDACRMAGKWQAALDHLAEAQRLAEEPGNRWHLAETLLLRGQVLAAVGERTAAEASHREATALAQQQGAKLWELYAAMSLARLWRDQGKRSEACDLLTPVYGWFTEGFGTPVLQQAKALLAELA